MKLLFKVSTSPGVFKITSKYERLSLLHWAVRCAARLQPNPEASFTFSVDKNLQLTVDWHKKFLILVTKDEAEDWFPVLC